MMGFTHTVRILTIPKKNKPEANSPLWISASEKVPDSFNTLNEHHHIKVLYNNNSYPLWLICTSQKIQHVHVRNINLPRFLHCDLEWEDLTQYCWAAPRLKIWGSHLERCLRCRDYWGFDAAWSEWKYAAPTEAPKPRLTARSAREKLQEMICKLCLHSLGDNKRRETYFECL